jgi:GDP-L-fucose synthase
MKILITGGAGFIGRNMIRHIKEFFENSSITVVDDLSEDLWAFFNQDLRRKVDHFYRCDVTKCSWEGEHYDLVIHCAAVVKGKEHQVSSPLSVAKNLAIDQAVIGAVQNGLADELVYFSSCAAYGAAFQNEINPTPDHEERLLPEKAHVSLYPPEGIYGWCKIMGEVMCSQLVDKKITILRPFGGYGTDQKNTYPFPVLIERVKRGDNPVVIWGSGKQVRDWIHVKDICRLTFEAHTKNKGSLTVNLGTGIETSFMELAIQIVTQANRTDVVLKNDPSKPEGVAYRVADTLRMHRLGLSPLIKLEEGIEMFLREEI